MGDLENVDSPQAALDEERVEILLEISRQEEALASDRAHQHDRGVVDDGALVDGHLGNGAPIGPQHVDRESVEPQPIAGRKLGRIDPDPLQPSPPRTISRAGSDRARLEDPLDAVTTGESREPRDVVLVGMGQDDEIDPPIPRWQPLIEPDAQPIGIRAAVHEQPAPARPGDQDRIALPHVEDFDRQRPVRQPGEHGRPGRGHDRQRDQANGPRSTSPSSARWRARFGQRWPRGRPG